MTEADAAQADPREVLATPTDPSFEREPDEIERLEAHGTYIVTCAQNNTEPERKFLQTLKVAAQHKGAELLVIPIRYKNPTSRRDPQDENDSGYWWHREVEPYLVENELRVHRFCRIMADVKTQATVTNPLPSSRDARSQDASAIYGHGQLVMKTVPTPQHRLPKILYTTGAVTQRNYSTTAAGDLASFHHSNAAILLEVRGRRFFPREMTWDRRTETLYDLDTVFTPTGVRKAGRALAVYTGDEHEWFIDPAAKDATYGANGLVETVRPYKIVRGDVFDGYTVNPHETGLLTAAAKTQAGLHALEDELESMVHHLNTTTPEWAETLITPSNHHDFLKRWLEGDPRRVEPQNRKLYHYLCWRMLEEMQRTDAGVEMPDPLEMYCRGKVSDRIRFLKTDESFQMAGVELGMHGHLGPNGARGNVKNLARIGTRSMVGHGHGSWIWQGVYMVGLLGFYRQGYNKGPSGWLQCNGVLHENGKRQMSPIIDGMFRA